MSDKILKDFYKFITPKYVPRKRTGTAYNNFSDEIKIVIIDPINWYYNYLFVANTQNFEY